MNTLEYRTAESGITNSHVTLVRVEVTETEGLRYQYITVRYFTISYILFGVQVQLLEVRNHYGRWSDEKPMGLLLCFDLYTSSSDTPIQ